jgi:hypothetical protein
MAWYTRRHLDPPDWDIVRELLAFARAAKESLDIFLPVMMWRGEDGEGGFAVMPGRMQELAGAVADLRGTVEHVQGPHMMYAVVVDGYGRTHHTSDAPVGPGDLGEMFHAGDPVVVEQLMVLTAGRGMQGVRAWRQVYRHTPVDGWEWDAVEYLKRPVLPDTELTAALSRS